MFRNFKLATKFTLLLSLVFLCGILLSGFALSKALEHLAENEITYRGQILMEMVNSVRDYTDKNVSPLLTESLETKQNFIPETVPSFSSRQVFEILRKNKEYTNFLYKDATLNPTNLRDKADEFETKLVKRFQGEPEMKALSGFRTLFGEKVFYSARPLSIKKQSCLRCHNTPKEAPKSLLATYGSENGFGWKLNNVLATQIIYVPASEVFDNARQASSIVLAIFFSIFTIAILLINFLLKRSVIQPIQPMAQLAQKISADTLGTDETEESALKSVAEVAKRTDELGQLGRVFQRMAREVYAREQRLKQQVQQLRIEIDQVIRARQVEEIAETDFFQKLTKDAKEIRSRREKFDAPTSQVEEVKSDRQQDDNVEPDYLQKLTEDAQNMRNRQERSDDTTPQVEEVKSDRQHDENVESDYFQQLSEAAKGIKNEP